MDPLEKQLKRALERKEPSAGFAERVLARVREKPRAAEPAPAGWRGFPFLWRPAWHAALAGGLAVVMLFGAGLAYRRRQERRRAEEARAQLITALQITSAELNRVRLILMEPTRSTGQTRE